MTNLTVNNPENSNSSVSLPLHKLTYTGKELNELLHISSVTRWRLECRGALKAVPGLRRKLYSRATVESFINGKAS